MAVEAINEYIEVSEHCLKAKKSDGGCFGYPAALLLFCVTNALGVYLRGDNIQIDGRTQTIPRGEPFRVLNHPIFGLDLKGAQVDLLEECYRNKLAHNAIIEVGAVLIHAPGQLSRPFIFTSNQVQVINLDSFHRLVAAAWEKFPRNRIEAWAKQRRARL
jgi:hypothetical protein